MEQNIQSFWSISTTELLKKLQVTVSGLTTNEANNRLKDYGANRCALYFCSRNHQNSFL